MQGIVLNVSLGEGGGGGPPLPRMGPSLRPGNGVGLCDLTASCAGFSSTKNRWLKAAWPFFPGPLLASFIPSVSESELESESTVSPVGMATNLASLSRLSEVAGLHGGVLSNTNRLISYSCAGALETAATQFPKLADLHLPTDWNLLSVSLFMSVDVQWVVQGELWGLGSLSL